MSESQGGPNLKLYLEQKIEPFSHPLYYRDKILMCGSCFAEEIGKNLQDHYFNTTINPHGILFNPLSIARALTTYLEGRAYESGDLLQQGELWVSPDHHGRFSGPDKTKVLNEINRQVSLGSEALLNGNWLIITFGTSEGWFFRNSGKIAGNCHKLPSSGFKRSLIPYSASVNTLSKVFKEVFERNPKLRIILTVSPVRYIKYGITENTISKAHLFLTVQELMNKFNRVTYFPAYELVNDNLRDYRFFKEDLVHPNNMAVDFVWEKFVETALKSEDVPVLQEVKEYLAFSRHRILYPGTEAAKRHSAQLEERKRQLFLKYPFLSEINK